MSASDLFFQKGSLDGYSISEIANLMVETGMEKDTVIRKAMVSTYMDAQRASISHLAISELAGMMDGLEINSIRKVAEKRYVALLVNTDKIKYPPYVHEQIATLIEDKRCSHERGYLTSQSKALLQKLALGIGLDHYLSLSKRDLCQAIIDVTAIAKASTNKELRKCFQGLASIDKHLEDSLEGDKQARLDYIKKKKAVLSEEMATLNRLLAQWEDVEFYRHYKYCKLKDATSGECYNLFSSLHEFATRIRVQSKICNSKIAEMSRELKVNKIMDTDNFLNKIKARFF